MNFASANRTRPYTRFQRKIDTICEFPSIIEQFFDPYIRTAGYEGTFEWSSVELFYNDNQDTLSICYALRMFCDFVLKLFLRFNCGHEGLLIKITYLYEQVKSRRHGNFEARFCQDCEQFQCRKQYHLNSRPLLREVNEEREHIYKHYTFISAKSQSYRSFIPSSFNEDHYTYNDHLRYQAKYGLIIMPNCEEIASKHFFYLRYKYYKMQRLADGPQHSEDIWCDLLLAMKNPNFRRLILIFDAMSNCTIVDEKCQMNHAKSFGLYSLTSSEPAISQTEVQELLDFSFADDIAFKTYAFSSFMEFFAHSPKLPSPRSLKHLCRCKIRDCLPRSPPMPTALYQIELLPNYLKDYILFLCN